MLENKIIRYFSCIGVLVSGILICMTIWNSRLFPVALAFTGLLTIALTAIADSVRERKSDRELILDTTYQQEQKVMRPRFLCYGQGRNKKCA